jgi:hypothetical protein
VISFKNGHLVATGSTELVIDRFLKYFKLEQKDLEKWLAETSPIFRKKGKKQES